MAKNTKVPVVLIMTSTITPPSGVPGLERVDPRVRLEDYRSALAFYATMLGEDLDKIVFVENSNSDVSALRDEVEKSGHRDRVEFVVFDGLDYPARYGRGYGEMKLLDYGMAHSKLIGELDPDRSQVWKVTGRYQVRNLGKLVRNAPRSFDLYCDMRSHSGAWLDMRVMAWSPAGYDKILRGIYPLISKEDPSGQEAEGLMFREVSSRLGLGKVVSTFTVEPLVEGIRAFDNLSWSNYRHHLVYHVRSIQRRLFGKVRI